MFFVAVFCLSEILLLHVAGTYLGSGLNPPAPAILTIHNPEILVTKTHMLLVLSMYYNATELHVLNKSCSSSSCAEKTTL